MTPEEHERERRAFWDACCAASVTYAADENCPGADKEAAFCAALADLKLAERDKRWPGPIVATTEEHNSCLGCVHNKPLTVDSACQSCVGCCNWSQSHD